MNPAASNPEDLEVEGSLTMPSGFPFSVDDAIEALYQQNLLLYLSELSAGTFPRALRSLSLGSLRRCTNYNYHGGEYGKSTHASSEAMKLAALDGIELEETYSAKAFAALVDAAKSEKAPKTFLLWQTNAEDF